jgi:hypothetical protein
MDKVVSVTDYYKRWFEDDFNEEDYKKINFTKEEGELFDNEEYKIYRNSPEKHLNGGYFYFKVTEHYFDEDKQGNEIEILKLSMVWGVEGEHQDFGEAKFDRTNKKFIYE